MKELDYTISAKKSIEKYEAATYGSQDFDVYDLIKCGQLTVEDVLWYHAFSGYTYLCSMPLKNEQIAAEIRRYLFREKIGGKEKTVQSIELDSEIEKEQTLYCLPDGSCYDRLTAPEILSKMIKVLQESYMECHLTSDEGIAYKIPLTPAAFRKFLLQEVTNRDNLIRMAFALRLKREEFNRFLTSGSYLRELSAAVPREMILLYCIENGRFEWEFVNKLQRKAEKYKKEAYNENHSENIDTDSRFIYTQNAKTEWAEALQGMDAKRFQEEILKPCCRMAVRKSLSDKQYSMSSFEKMYQYSILKDLAAEMGNCKVYEDYDTVFVTETVRRYWEHLNLPEDYWLFKSENDDKVMSADSYCRFLAYRMMMPNTEGRHNVKFYRSRYGLLPNEIRSHVMKVSDIDKLRSLDCEKSKVHSINRYDIMVVKFYYFLMKSWKEGGPFLAENRESADKQWRKFFAGMNADLQDTGYPKMTNKNPMDAMLRICFHSICPLECYNRIYELDILHSIIEDPDGYSTAYYPKPERIRAALDGLERSYQKICKIDPVKEGEWRLVEDFKKRIQQKDI